LDAARGILFDKGMAGASMNQIAQAAELSVGTLYLYFENKEELFAALQEEGLDILHGMIRKAQAKEGSVEGRLREIALAYLEFSEQYRKYFDIINYFLTSPDVEFPQNLKSEIDTRGNKILSVVKKVFTDDADTEDVDPDAAGKCALIMWGALHGLLQMRKLQDTILRGEDYRELYLDGCDSVIRSLIMEIKGGGKKK